MLLERAMAVYLTRLLLVLRSRFKVARELEEAMLKAQAPVRAIALTRE